MTSMPQLLVGVQTALIANGVIAISAQLALGALWRRSRLPAEASAAR
jgi:hypothetical protein